MTNSWLKYLFAFLALAGLVAFLYYLSQRAPNASRSTGTPSSKSQDSKQVIDSIIDFDFYRFLPDSEEVVPDPSQEQSPKSPAAYDQTVFQVGAYNNEQEANRHRAQLILLNFPVWLEKTEIDQQTWYRLRIGPLAGEDFERIRQRLIENEIEYFLTRPKQP